MRIAMDDFGTGYSSLSNLRAFPFDKIKIDGSFMSSVDSNEQAATIVRAVLGLGRGLGLPVLAEGVETQAELAFHAILNWCNGGRGYLHRGVRCRSRPSQHSRMTTRRHSARRHVLLGEIRLTELEPLGKWYSWVGSNHRPPDPQSGARTS